MQMRKTTADDLHRVLLVQSGFHVVQRLFSTVMKTLCVQSLSAIMPITLPIRRAMTASYAPCPQDPTKPLKPIATPARP
jgi:hypothetical protein